MLLRGDVFEEMAELKHQLGRELQIYGSGTLIRTLMQKELIDDYRCSCVPSHWAAASGFFSLKGLPRPLSCSLIPSLARVSFTMTLFRLQRHPRHADHDGDSLADQTVTNGGAETTNPSRTKHAPPTNAIDFDSPGPGWRRTAVWTSARRAGRGPASNSRARSAVARVRYIHRRTPWSTRTVTSPVSTGTSTSEVAAGTSLARAYRDSAAYARDSS